VSTPGPRLPAVVKSVHLIGVGGTGMGAFAGLLKSAGLAVRGSDEGVYPPMSDKLKDWGIEVRTPYAPANLEPAADLVIVGNVIRAVNVEARAAIDGGMAYTSFPAALGALFLDDRHGVVVAGTHGKTTTTTLLAHTLLDAGRDAGFLVGGVPLGLGESFRPGQKGAPFVVEGDEYDTAFFDKGPKFLHYRPRSLLVTSLEYDHADIYASVEQIEDRFAELLLLVPADGHIVVRGGLPHVERAVAKASAAMKARIVRYGEGGDVVAHALEIGRAGQSFDVVIEGTSRGSVTIPLHGPHNVENALGAYAILAGLGLTHAEIAHGFSTFAGVKRRLEVRGEEAGGIVVDDFAHHPTAIAVTLEGARARWPDHRLVALFEPRSATSCRRVFQDAFARAFDAADEVILAPPGRQLAKDEALDVDQLARDITTRGIPAVACPSLDDVVARAIAVAGPCIVLGMSNGAFGDAHRRILDGRRMRGALASSGTR
jgi:UDP-N-acetylmuramate: L-alanyl-gamma-D-glutamyl-meso-diaminopimelate ligase